MSAEHDGASRRLPSPQRETRYGISREKTRGYGAPLAPGQCRKFGFTFKVKKKIPIRCSVSSTTRGSGESDLYSSLFQGEKVVAFVASGLVAPEPMG